jgi:hypothetical protein
LTGYPGLLLLLSARTRVWIAVLFSACFVPAFVVFSSPRAPGTSGSGETASTTILLLAAVWSVNLTALAIHDEKTRVRSRLLRVAGVDGFRAAWSFLMVGFVTVAVVTAVGFLSCGLVALQRSGEFAPWARSGLAAILVLAGIAPLGVVGGYVLPRTLALVVLNALAIGFALLAARDVFAFGWLGKSLALPIAVASIQAACVPLLAILWRKTSERLW